MIDLEKAIKGLECHLKEQSAGKTCFECPYLGDNPCETQLISDALAMLKEQEPVEPEVEVLNEIDRLYRCQRCHGYLFYDGQKYCDRCGQEVKWDA